MILCSETEDGRENETNDEDIIKQCRYNETTFPVYVNLAAIVVTMPEACN